MISSCNAGGQEGEPGTLVEGLDVRVLNCSPGGCLLETARPVKVGTVAALELSLDGNSFSDVAQVVRCQAIGSNTGIHHVAMQFLSITPPYAGSLRHAMRRNCGEAAGRLTVDDAQ
jgi:PilZ domain